MPLCVRRREMTMGFPLMILGIFVAVFILLFLWKFVVWGQRDRGAASSHLAGLCGSYLMLIFYMYIMLTKSALDIFNCNPLAHDDGHTYLSVVFVPCGEPGGLQLTLLPLAIGAFMTFTVGFPAILFYFLFTNRRLIMEDQVGDRRYAPIELGGGGGLSLCVFMRVCGCVCVCVCTPVCGVAWPSCHFWWACDATAGPACLWNGRQEDGQPERVSSAPSAAQDVLPLPT